ncbi:hypothetical protein KVF89_20120 [Nocardioides carbamazepini]|uniref:hypothetical protein n=1 Tax=Nocardioides carbamazepini TaxID=2854259 RepID=UPI002149E4DC|nr:hypothetical protein [Nocardioides carbamazepini]MCR1784860.1 hypothetical protein [Nocardioides carbamazepini]
MQDIIDRLQAELGERRTPPPAFEIGTTIGAGRRAVRRRRLAVTTAGLALALVAGGTLWSATGPLGEQGRDRSVPVAAAAGVRTDDLHPTSDLPADFPVGYDARTGDLLVQRDWTVVDRVNEPITGSALDADSRIVASAALAVRNGDQDTWVLVYKSGTEDDGSSASQSGDGVADPEASTVFPDLDTWVAYQADLLFTGSTDQLVAFDDDGRLAARYGVRLVRQGGPLPFLADGVPVRLRVGSEQVWGVAHRADDLTLLAVESDYPAADERGTMAGFVEYLRTGR